MRVLVVEGHAALREMLTEHLRERGFAVDPAGSAAQALAAAAVARFDALVLDLGLPDADGLELLAALRRGAPDLAAIILTARDRLEQRLSGLDAGADDYMVKPFDVLELEARLRAVLRRPGRRQGTRYTHGGLTFDPRTREASVQGAPLELTRREAALLEELLRTPGQVIAKDILEERLYALEDAGSANALEAAISRLRRKLIHARAALRIETQWGIGYRLVETETGPA